MTRLRPSRLIALATAGVIACTGLLASAPASASPAAPSAKHVTLVVTVLPAQVRLIPGESVMVRLSTNRTTGYSWSARTLGHRSSVKVGKGVYTAPTTDLIGAPGTTEWLVTAKADGKAVVRFLATPPGGGSRVSEGALTVIVRQ